MTTSTETKPFRRFDLERRLRDSDLPPLSRLVWLTIATYTMGETGLAKDFAPSLEELSNATGLSRRAVMEHIGRLEQEEWIVRARGGPGRPTRYGLTFPGDEKPPTAPPIQRVIPPDRRCLGARVGGDPCDEWTVKGSTYCWVHLDQQCPF